MKRAILWDQDGVLVRTEDLYFSATQRVMRDLGVDLERETYRRQFMQDGVDPLRGLLERRGQTASFAEHHRTRIRHHMRLLHTQDVFLEGASETVHALSGAFRMGVVTGAKRSQVDVVVDRTDFFHLFEFVVSYDDVARTKPDPEPYAQGVRRLGLPAEACVAIEDSVSGLRSAKAAGLECWVIPNALTREEPFDGADRVLAGIGEVRTLLEGAGL